MGENRFDDPVIISFSQTVSAFGTYWGAGYACSGFLVGNTISFTFFDAGGNQIGTDAFTYNPPNKNGATQWHGYAFDTPIKTISSQFVVTDGMQATVAGLNLACQYLHPLAGVGRR
jgi:hypothetical protein